ncbi:MAG TPA: coproporphyrinogen-III oxidase family protein [Streptosporangiaceae bacterium]|nr:coproporphyrinogen-III oxidase family protein [Streptosporangiaceae bacterium]
MTAETGNYFVANYPPFSAWTQSEVGTVLRALSLKPREDTELGVYVHIPFCRKRCHFCYFKVYTDRGKDEISAYVDALASEAAAYSEKPAIAGRQVTFLYLGGGTPSYLSVRHLRKLHSVLRTGFDLSGLREFTFEGEPGTLSPSKIEVIKEIGVTRLSIGAENFGDEVLKLNGRAHDSQQIYAAYAAAVRAGIGRINIDLIAGMLGETDANWRESVARVIELAPASVTIYQLEIPHNTGLYAQITENGALAGIASWETKRNWLEFAFAELERAGYQVSSGYTLSRPLPGNEFVYTNSLWRGADLVGLGVSSFAHVSGVHYQNEHSLAAYLSRVQGGELPLLRALEPTPRELMIREFILQMKLGRVSLGYFRDKFGTDPLETFREPLDDLLGRDLITLNGDEVTLARQALLRVDSLLPAFFLPQHRNVRYS